jgi:hypothetical protein
MEDADKKHRWRSERIRPARLTRCVVAVRVDHAYGDRMGKIIECKSCERKMGPVCRECHYCGSCGHSTACPYSKK